MRSIRLAIVFVSLWSVTSTTWATCTTIPASTPDSQLVDDGDGTITDTATSLIWRQCSEGQANDTSCTGSALTYTWQQALQIPQTLNTSGGFAGHTDWRLPNLKELRSIVEEACYSPSINSTRFPNTPSSNFWSASANAKHSGNAWYVDFDHGFSNDYGSYRRYGRHVRLVRGGQ
jgi:hypothetical protein